MTVGELGYFQLLGPLESRSRPISVDQFQKEMLLKYGDRLTIKDIGLQSIEGMNNGFVALRDIPSGSVCLRVPFEAMLTENTALSDSIFGSWVKKFPMITGTPDLLLSLYLTHEFNNAASPWKSYIHILPVTFNTPFYLSKTGFDLLLKGTCVYDKIISIMNIFTNQYRFIRKILETNPLPYLKADNFTFALFMWANSIVMTRRNIIETASGKKVVSLIPMWDMCNHSFTQSVNVNTAFDSETMNLECWAGSDIKLGQQFCMNYGERCNADLYTFSGFVADGHPNDFIQVPIQIGDQERRIIVGKLTGTPKSKDGMFRFPLYGKFDNPQNRNLFLAIQLLIAQPEDIKHFDNSESFWISEELKKQTLNWIKVKLLVMRKKLNSVDISTVMLPEADEPTKTALVYRNNEIKFMTDFIESLSK